MKPSQKQAELKHVGVLGMKWGVRRTNPQTKAITDRANKILNNPKSSQKELDDDSKQPKIVTERIG
jgi:hypothetical protein